MFKVADACIRVKWRDYMFKCFDNYMFPLMIQCLSFDDALQQLGGIKCSVYKISEINNHQTKNKEHCHCSVIVAVSSIKDNITSVCIYTCAVIPT